MRWFIYIVLMFTVLPQLSAQQKLVYKKKVYFEFNKYDLRPADNRAFVAFLRAIKSQEGGILIKLTGHTDFIDVDPYNDKLGFNRANAVKQYLVAKGVPAETIQINSKGERVAIADNTTDTGRALNRRVEMELYAISGGLPDGGLQLTGDLYDAVTKEKLKGTIKVSIDNPREVDRNKIKLHKEVETYSQAAIAGRTYTVYVDVEGYIPGTYSLTIPAGSKKGTFRQDAYLNKLIIKKRFDYERIYFVPNKDEFRTIAHPELQKLLRYMQHDTTIVVEIRGHINYTKNRKPMNEVEQFLFYDLSLRRAIAVYNYLVHFGVNPNRMSYRGMSNKELKVPYARTLEECQRNMRVEIVVLDKGGDTPN